MPVETYNSEAIQSAGIAQSSLDGLLRGRRPSPNRAQQPTGRWKPSKVTKQRLRLAVDTVILAFAFLLAYKLRFDFFVPGHVLRDALIQLPIIMAVELAVLKFFGVSKFVWRYTGLVDASAFVTAGLVSMVVILTLRVLVPDELSVLQVPFSVAMINVGLAFGGMLGLRVVRRAMFEQAERSRRIERASVEPRQRILLVGAGHAGIMTAREILSRGDLEIVGFLDDNPQIQQTIISGIKVLGPTTELPRLTAEHSIDQVVISLVQGTRKQFRQIIELCESASVRVRVIPTLSEVLQGKVNVSRLRDVQVEDLLGREPVQLEEAELERFLRDKVVMVTGAGGSIGSELARQVARFKPRLILLVERSEPSLFEIHRELVGSHGETLVVPLVADVCDKARMRQIFESYKPQLIFHAAAHKHVPMMEMNSSEAVKNNVFGTRGMAELAGRHSVEAFVLVSTDKAVCPSSIMGASKRVSELVIQWMNQRYANTRYMAVRFGNVIGSAGSVVRVFQDQIRKGGPVTVTHPEMYRYFMTIPEASQLLLQAGAIGKGGEILILDMGEPVSILELAEDTISLSGLKPFEDIEVVFTGPRPGEKLLEQLDLKSESFARTRHPKIFIGRLSAYPEMKVSAALKKLEVLSKASDEPELRKFLTELLPEAQLGPAINGNGKATSTREVA